MAQVGDTITYTYSGSRVSEDVSSVDLITVVYCSGAGGGGSNAGGDGGLAEDVDINVSDVDTLYLWVADYGSNSTWGRFDGGAGDASGPGSGSTEIALPSQLTGTNDAPLLVGAGGGKGADGFFDGGGGARGGVGVNDGAGTPPPQGGGQNNTADGYINSSLSRVSGGTTTAGGGGSGPDGETGEIQITYKSLAPDAPSNVQITDAQTEGELTVDWDPVSGAAGYYIYRAQSSGSTTADYTQVADVTAPPYTDTGLEDGERYFYRVSSHT